MPSTKWEGDRIEVWDAEDFAPWETLKWPTVRVLAYRQHKPNGTVIEAYWHTNFLHPSSRQPELFHIAKSRWEIENQGFNEGKNPPWDWSTLRITNPTAYCSAGCCCFWP